MKINFVSKCIEVSNAEMKRAQNYGSREYEMLMQVMKELPDFQITVKQPTHTPHNPCARLTYEMMEHFIEAYAPDMMEEYRNIRIGGYHYSRVKQWFLANFPDASRIPQFAA